MRPGLGALAHDLGQQTLQPFNTARYGGIYMQRVSFRSDRSGTKAILFCLFAMATFLALSVHPAWAQSPASAPHPKIDSGDTSWMLTSSALVLLMTPGLALFYAGMVRSKNVLSVLMQSFVACGLITVQWVLFGYSLAFGPDHHGLIGDLSWAGLRHVSSFTADPDYAPTIPHQVYCMFQLMFAIITPALISGAIVERMKFSAYLLFMLLWATFVYDPLAHWVWGYHGWLQQAGALDFAGGSVVHMSSGFSALTLAIILGRRKKTSGGEELRPHNLPMTLTGVALLWFGWFGFNAGSAVSSGQLAASAFTATHIATATAAMTWLALDWLVYKKPTALGFGSGAVAGLVAITPACGFVTPLGALICGVVVSCVCFFAIRLKNLMKADDALDVFGVHGIGGLCGCILTGLLATVAVNTAGANGLFNGNPHQLVLQLMDAGSTIAIAVIGTTIIAYFVKFVCGGLRAADEDEEMGLDVTDHGENGYSTDTVGSPALAAIH
jgi:Amt family ammonium transporter